MTQLGSYADESQSQMLELVIAQRLTSRSNSSLEATIKPSE